MLIKVDRHYYWKWRLPSLEQDQKDAIMDAFWRPWADHFWLFSWSIEDRRYCFNMLIQDKRKGLMIVRHQIFGDFYGSWRFEELDLVWPAQKHLDLDSKDPTRQAATYDELKVFISEWTFRLLRQKMRICLIYLFWWQLCCQNSLSLKVWFCDTPEWYQGDRFVVLQYSGSSLPALHRKTVVFWDLDSEKSFKFAQQQPLTHGGRFWIKSLFEISPEKL